MPPSRPRCRVPNMIATSPLVGGIVFLSHQIGSFLGVWMGGYLYDRFGSYDPVWWVGVALGVFAAIVHWPIEERAVARPAMA
jgi:predicted MFS family arabinose efflux permease